MLYRVVPLDRRKQPVLSKVLRESVLTLFHHALPVGHSGITRMVKGLLITYYRPHMAADCIESPAVPSLRKQSDLIPPTQEQVMLVSGHLPIRVSGTGFT